jgi:hypothetical protein
MRYNIYFTDDPATKIGTVNEDGEFSDDALRNIPAVDRVFIEDHLAAGVDLSHHWDQDYIFDIAD